MSHARRPLALLATFTVLAAAPAAAQSTDFSTLQAKVRPGSYVTVVTPDGKRALGRLVSVTPASMTFEPGEPGWTLGAPVTYTPDAVARIERDDSVFNGVFLGAATGPLITLGILYRAGGSDSFGAVMVNGSVLFGAAGAVVGLLIDDTIKERAFTGPGRVQAGISPMFGGGRTGVAVSLGF